MNVGFCAIAPEPRFHKNDFPVFPVVELFSFLIV